MFAELVISVLSSQVDSMMVYLLENGLEKYCNVLLKKEIENTVWKWKAWYEFLSISGLCIFGSCTIWSPNILLRDSKNDFVPIIYILEKFLETWFWIKLVLANWKADGFVKKEQIENLLIIDILYYISSYFTGMW